MGGKVVDQLSEGSLGLAALGQDWGHNGGTAVGGISYAPEDVVQSVQGELLIMELKNFRSIFYHFRSHFNLFSE